LQFHSWKKNERLKTNFILKNYYKPGLFFSTLASDWSAMCELMWILSSAGADGSFFDWFRK
jgi:hypothetical protein